MARALDEVLGEANPLSLFDYITAEVVNGTATPELKETISRIRKDVEEEESILERYRLVKGYTDILTDKMAGSQRNARLQEIRQILEEQHLFS